MLWETHHVLPAGVAEALEDPSGPGAHTEARGGGPRTGPCPLPSMEVLQQKMSKFSNPQAASEKRVYLRPASHGLTHDRANLTCV